MAPVTLPRVALLDPMTTTKEGSPLASKIVAAPPSIHIQYNPYLKLAIHVDNNGSATLTHRGSGQIWEQSTSFGTLPNKGPATFTGQMGVRV
jgi:hypothetical protein